MKRTLVAEMSAGNTPLVVIRPHSEKVHAFALAIF